MPPKPNNNNKCHIFFFHCELENKKTMAELKFSILVRQNDGDETIHWE